ncbi:MAG: hypothetical protein FJ119_00700 [Deltaproteobacteria bacterium]|nr:hypothetical protein [Deltaproteobacteria bacterium]
MLLRCATRYFTKNNPQEVSARKTTAACIKEQTGSIAREVFLALSAGICYTPSIGESRNEAAAMSEEEEKDNELEELFTTFDKQFADCEQKFSEIEENLKAFRDRQNEQADTPPENSE